MSRRQLTVALVLLALGLVVTGWSVVERIQADAAYHGVMVLIDWPWALAALPIVVAHTFELLTQNFDMISVSYFLGAEAIGIYFAALKTIALLAFVNFAVGAATANRVASLHAAGRTEEFEAQIQGAVNLAFWPTLVGAVAIVGLPWRHEDIETNIDPVP